MLDESSQKCFIFELQLQGGTAMKVLNSREVKKLKEDLVIQFGAFLTGDYAFFKNDKERIFIINKDIGKIDYHKANRIGLYFAENMNNYVRLSKEGAQLLVREAENVQNTVELSEDEVKAYFKGEDITKDVSGDNRQIILTYGAEVLGSARLKDGTILNHLPKISRTNSIII